MPGKLLNIPFIDVNNKQIESPLDCEKERKLSYRSEDTAAESSNNYQKYLSLAPKARAWASRYTYENTRSLYVNLVKPKKIFLGDKNEVTDEYLMTNSKILYKKYKDLYK